MNILIQNGTIITMQNKKIIRQGAIAIEDKTIVEVGKTQKIKKKIWKGL